METENIKAVLKPNGYKIDYPLSLKEELFNYPLSPVIAYGIDKGAHIEYQHATNEKDLEEKLLEIKKIALENNAKIKVDYSIQDIDGEKLFITSPHEYAAEKILDKEFLALVSRELGSESFLVGIPHQGVFAAISSMSPLQSKFSGFIKQKFENPEANIISPHTFEINNGEIVMVGGEELGSTQNTILQKSNGDIILELNSHDLEEFKTQFTQGYPQAMQIALKSKTFSGNLIFNENNNQFKFDEIVLEKCRSYEAQILENEMAQTICKVISGNGIIPAFTQMGVKVDISKCAPDTSKKKWWQFGK